MKAQNREGNIFMDRGDKFLLYKKILWDLPKPQAISAYVLEQLPQFDL
jgi:hypothetical protein